jgi:hypothetical protein
MSLNCAPILFPLFPVLQRYHQGVYIYASCLFKINIAYTSFWNANYS